MKPRSQWPTCQLLQLILCRLDSGTETESPVCCWGHTGRAGGAVNARVCVCARAGPGSHSALPCAGSLASKCDFSGASISLSRPLRSEMLTVKSFSSSCSSPRPPASSSELSEEHLCLLLCFFPKEKERKTFRLKLWEFSVAFSPLTPLPCKIPLTRAENSRSLFPGSEE